MSRISSVSVVLLCTVAAVAAWVVRPASQTPESAYVLYTAESRRALPFRTLAGVDFLSLDELAGVFGLTVVEDTVVGGLTVQGRGQTVLLIPGQSFASIGPGRVVSLPAAVQRDGGSWQVPVAFVRLVLGPAFGQRVEVREATHVILMGDARLPEVGGRIAQTGSTVRLTLDIEPPAPHSVTREGRQLFVRFEAVDLAFSPVPDLPGEFISAIRAEGAALVIDLGPSVSGYRATDADAGHLVIDFPVPGAPPLSQAPPPRATAPAAAPVASPRRTSARTIVLDPGHGGADEGVRGPGGTLEKDYVLQIARRIKTAVESRIGLRVLLTRDGDETVPVDRRTSLANNNKADLFISLHVDAAVRPGVRGAQVLSLNPADYRQLPEAARTNEPAVPLVGGGSRLIDVVAWDLAQMPFADRSAEVAAVLVRRLRERGVPLQRKPVVRLPLRTLVGANMPAVMIEMGVLSSPADEAGLNGPAISDAIVDAVVSTINDVRLGGGSEVPVTRP